MSGCDSCSLGTKPGTPSSDRIKSEWRLIRNLLLWLTLVGFSCSLAFRLPRTVHAANFTWDGGGTTSHWSEAANWTGDTLPTSNDQVFFDATSTKECVIDVNVSVAGLWMNSGYTGTITQATNSTIMIGNLEFRQASGTFNGGSGFIDVNSQFSLSGGTFNSTNSTLFLGAAFSHSGGTFNHNNGSITFDTNGGSINVSQATDTFNNVSYSKNDHVSMSVFGPGGTAAFRTLGTLALVDGEIFGDPIEADGDVTIGPNFDSAPDAFSPATLNIAGSASRTIIWEAGVRLLNVNLNAASVMLQTSGAGTLTWRSLTLQSGTINQGGVDFDIRDSYSQSGGIFNGSGNTINFRGTYMQTGGTFNGGSGNLDLDNSFNLSGAGSTFKSTSGTLFVAGPFSHQSGSFNHNSGTLTIDGGGSMTISQANEIFNNVTFSLGTGVSKSLSGPGSGNAIFKVVGKLNLNTGTIFGGDPIDVQGDVTVGASFQGGMSQPITFSGSANQTYTNSGGINPNVTWTVNKSGGTLSLASDMDLSNGSGNVVLTSGTVTTGNFKVNIGTRGVTRTSGYIIGNLQRSYISTGAKTFDVGTANGYSPVTANVTTLSANPSSLTARATQGTHPNLNAAVSLGRYWTIGESGNLTANLTFSYLDPIDINGNETDYRAAKIDANVNFFTNAQVPIDPTNNRFTVNGVTDFSTWTLGTPQVLISPANISLAVQGTQTFTASGGIPPFTFSIVAPNQSGGTINSTTGQYSAGTVGNVQDTVRVTDADGKFANAIVTVVPGAPHHLRFTQQPSNTVQGMTIAPALQVRVEDQFNNTVTTATNAVTMAIANNPANGNLSGSSTQTPVSGIASFNNLSIDNFGDAYTLNATSPGLAFATSNSFNILGFLVINTNDSGPGSLRQTITNANNTPGTQTITFNIPGAAPFTIVPATPMPTITQPIVIDGTSQPSFAGIPLIELGSQSIDGNFGLKLAGGNSTVKGLIITACGIGIWVVSNNNVISGNYIGVNAAGNTARGNSDGIRIEGANTLVGGTTSAQRNVISGNATGIHLFNASSTVIQGNYIGTDALGTSALRNQNEGIYVQTSLNTTTIGGLQPGEANIIAFNPRNVRVDSGKKVSIRGNSIHSSGFFGGIDLWPWGLNQNDPGDADSGANERQNYPDLGFVTGTANTTRIQGTLNSTANTQFAIDFYSNPHCSTHGAKTYLGSVSTTTSSTYIASFDVTLPIATTLGEFIYATATDPNGNTSEISQCRMIASGPVSISGRIVNANNVALPNAAVNLTGLATKSTVTNSNGDYSFTNLIAGGAYMVTPSLFNHTLAPASRNYSSLTTNQTNQDFTGTKTKSMLVGTLYQITPAGTVPVVGATVTLTNQLGSTSQTLPANPVYVFPSLFPGEYLITPEKPGVVFSPASQLIQISTTDRTQNFIGTTGSPLPGRFIFNFYGHPGSMNADGTALVSLLHQTNTEFLGGAVLSPDGKLLAGIIGGTSTLAVSSADGSNYRSIWFPLNFRDVRDVSFSPDGTKIAFIASGGSLKVINTDGSGLITVPVSSNLTFIRSPSWLSNSKILFSNFSQFFSINLDGTGFVPLTGFGDRLFPLASPNGSRIAFLKNNSLFTMNSDGSSETMLASDGRFSDGFAWSPDGTRICFWKTSAQDPNLFDFIAINSTTGGSPRIILREKTVFDRPSWGPAYEFTTPTGSNVNVNSGFTSITFAGVTSPGTTTITQVPASSTVQPGTFQFGGVNLAFEISTTASFTPPVNVCLIVPASVASTQTVFDFLFLRHVENGNIVDITTSRNFSTRTICGSANSLSPFVLTEQINSNLPSITGLVEDQNGNPLADVSVQLTGTETRATVTDAFGTFSFVNLTQGANYNVQPKQPGYVFTEYSQDLLNLTNENTLLFTGTKGVVQISGRVTNNNGNGVANVPIEVLGTTSARAVTDSNGDYSVGNLLVDGSYTVVPALANASFAPRESQLDSLTSDVASVDFQATIVEPLPIVPSILIEEGTVNRAVAVDSVTLVRGPFRILTDRNFSADHHTRVILFSSNLGLFQPDHSLLTVQAGGFDLPVENVGSLTGVPGLDCSYIVVRLPDGLPVGDLSLTVTLRGMVSNIAILSISP